MFPMKSFHMESIWIPYGIHMELGLKNNVRETPGKCPGNIREMSGKHPQFFSWKNVRETPGKCPGNAREMSGKHPGNVWETSGKCPGNTREMSEKHPGNSVNPIFWKTTMNFSVLHIYETFVGVIHKPYFSQIGIFQKPFPLSSPLWVALWFVYDP